MSSEQKKFRAKEKLEKAEIQKNNPSAVKPRSGPGQPPLVDSQPALLETIINIAIHGSAADEAAEQKWLEVVSLCPICMRGCWRWDSKCLVSSFTSTRFWYSGGKEARTHRPRKVRKTTDRDAQKSKRMGNSATIRSLECLASLLGPHQVFVLSQDDKAHVGLPAVKSHSPLLMHKEYRVLLPDHDWVVAERHKLIPSVYTDVNVDFYGFGKEEAVCYTHTYKERETRILHSEHPCLWFRITFISVCIQTLNDDRIEHREASGHRFCK